MQIAVFISSIDVVKPGWLLKYLKGIRPAHIKAMQQNLAKVCNQGHVEFNSLLPSAPLCYLILLRSILLELSTNAYAKLKNIVPFENVCSNN